MQTEERVFTDTLMAAMTQHVLSIVQSSSTPLPPDLTLLLLTLGAGITYHAGMTRAEFLTSAGDAWDAIVSEYGPHKEANHVE